MTNDYSQAVDTARNYYNSNDADNFYHTIWGGEDIHIGLYQSRDEDIFDASLRTVEHMCDRLDNLGEEARLLDLGSGYAGAARTLAQNNNCQVVALNLSEAQNERGRMLNRRRNLDHLIDVVDGSFEKVPYPDDSFDIVWSQDAILHSGDRPRVLDEVDRVIKPGGEFVFTDPMAADDCPEGVLDPILARIHLDTLGSPGFYREELAKRGFEEVGFEDHTHQLVNHYSRVLEETRRNEEELAKAVSPEYIERMKTGLKHWIEGGRNGHLAWGIFHFRKNQD
jgi:sarcosine/dimethylglycine N-methyltransferase